MGYSYHNGGTTFMGHPDYKSRTTFIGYCNDMGRTTFMGYSYPGLAISAKPRLCRNKFLKSCQKQVSDISAKLFGRNSIFFPVSCETLQDTMGKTGT